MMKSVRITELGGPEVLKVNNEVPIPEPGENQILMKVAYSGVNPVDHYIRQGTFFTVPDLPYCPGFDAAGTVAKVGAGVTEFKIGDRIFTTACMTGTMSEYIILEKDFAWPLGDRLSFQQGAALGIPYFTAERALSIRTNAKKEERVLVHGASGAAGVATCQLAKAAGLTVFATAGSPEGREMVQKAGAKHVFNHREAGYVDKILEATDGQGLDIIVEMAADRNLDKDIKLLTNCGRVMVIGCNGPVEIDPRLLFQKERSIIGVAVFCSEPEQWKLLGKKIVAGIEAGSINPVIDSEFSLEKSGDAHQEVVSHSRGGAFGKIVIKVAE